MKIYGLFVFFATWFLGWGLSVSVVSAQVKKDTVINGVPYHYLSLSAGGKLFEAGEKLEAGKKSGHWLIYDGKGSLREDVHFSEGMLDGPAIFFFRTEGQASTRESGPMKNGTRRGWWLASVQKKKGKDKWKTNYWTFYDHRGKISSRITFFKNGRPASLQEYDDAGKCIREIHYDKKGNIKYDGPPQNNVIPL